MIQCFRYSISVRRAIISVALVICCRVLAFSESILLLTVITDISLHIYNIWLVEFGVPDRYTAHTSDVCGCHVLKVLQHAPEEVGS